MAAPCVHFQRHVQFSAVGGAVLLLRASKILQNPTRQYAKLEKPVADPDLKLFMRDDIQTLLKRVTGYHIQKTFPRNMIPRAHRPNYKIFTDEELEQEKLRSEELKEKRLQMPPYMQPRLTPNVVLADDPDIAPILNSKFVFVDISDQTERIKNNNRRPVVCRDETGKLKLANRSVVDRVTSIYFPVSGRDVFAARFFKEEYLETILHPEKYLYILNRACAQFEPDSNDFIRVTHRVYEHLFEHQHFDVLHATRFFGPMTFYLCKNNKIEPLLVYMLDNDRLSDAIDVINLKRIIWNLEPMKTSQSKIIRDYMSKDANKKYVDELERAVRRHVGRRSQAQA